MHLNKFGKESAVALLLLGVLASCSISTDMDATLEREMEKAATLSEKAKIPAQKIEEDVVHVKNDIWLGDVSEIEYDGQPLPANFETKDGVTLISNRPITLYEIGDMISKITSLRVSFAGDMDSEARQTAMGNRPNPQNVNVDWTEPNKMLVSYQGPLSGLLDEIGSRFGIWWRYNQNEIYFYKNITRTFVLYSLPSQPSLQAQVGGSTSGGGGNSTIAMSNNMSLEFWGNIETSIKSMVEPTAQISMDSANGTVVVTASPNDIKKVAKFINEQNARLSRQVAISVKVYQVNISDQDLMNLDLAAAIATTQKAIADGAEQEVITRSLGIAGAQAAKLKTSASAANNLTMSLVQGDVNVSAIMQAMSQQTTTSLVTSGTVTTLNNRPAPIQVVKRQSYIKEMTKTNSGGDSNYYDISTDTEELETGFTMNVLPRILEHGRIMMMFNLTISDLISLDTIDLGSGKIVTTDSSDQESEAGFVQNPVIESRGFSQEVVMTSGQSLVLTGYERVENFANKSGVGSVQNSLLGGGAAVEKTRNIVVIVLTPVVLESPLNPESRMHNI